MNIKTMFNKQEDAPVSIMVNQHITKMSAKKKEKKRKKGEQQDSTNKDHIHDNPKGNDNSECYKNCTN